MDNGMLNVGASIDGDSQAVTLMLSTSAPGGCSCRAMVSDVSITKYTSKTQSCFSGRVNTQPGYDVQKCLQN